MLLFHLQKLLLNLPFQDTKKAKSITEKIKKIGELFVK